MSVQAVRAAYQSWVDRERIAAEIQERIDAGFARMQAAPSELAGLHGVDVHVLVIESYGAVAWRDSRLSTRQESLWRELSAQLAAHGFASVSGRVHPAITGGGSWMAHQELFTAVRVPDQRTFDRVLQAPARPLPGLFLAAGLAHRRSDAGDATPLAGRRRLLWLRHVAGAGRLPVRRAPVRVRPRARPGSSAPVARAHRAAGGASAVPGVRVDVEPCTVEGDAAVLRRLGAERRGTRRTRRVHELSWADVQGGERLFPAYRDSIEYALRSAVGYVSRLERPSLVLLLGDHQPPMPGQDTSFEVPLHVLSNRPELLPRWHELGFVDGDRPLAAATSMPLHDLAPTLLRLYQR
jgi:hypothetical protein